MKIIFREIKSDEDIKILAALARKIWKAYYPPIIGQKQVDYMLKKMYSFKSLKDQINRDKNVFYAAYIKKEMEGFISVSSQDGRNYTIHKLYISPGIQRKGLGKALIDYSFKNRLYKEIRLTVNRQNIQAINFYFKSGFVIEKVVDIDIGKGFFMNDFVMIYRNNFTPA